MMPGNQGNLEEDAGLSALVVLGLAGLVRACALTESSLQRSIYSLEAPTQQGQSQLVTLAFTPSYLANCSETHYCVGFLGQRAWRTALLSYLEWLHLTPSTCFCPKC